ncbi:MAG: penicillin-binding protein 2 [bacterium]
MENNFFPDNEKKEKKYSIKNRPVGSWVESSFGDYSWLHKNAAPHCGAFLGITIPKIKFLIIKIFIIVVATVLIGRVFYLQIAKGEQYKGWAETNRIRQIPIVAGRGIIYDRNQKALVTNIPDFYLALTPNDLPTEPKEKAGLIGQIAGIIDIPPESIEEQLSLFSSYNYKSIPIKTNITYEQAVKLEILNNTYPAIQVESGIGRKYDMPMSLSHIVGFLRKTDKNDLEYNPEYLPTDDIGKTGVESQYEKILRGTYGKKQIEVDALGRQTAVLAQENPVAGDDIVLSIDVDLQKKAEETLVKHMRANGASRGAVIVSDVNTGEILAMISAPYFDNNIFSGGLSVDDYIKLTSNPDKPMLNRAIAGIYPSGSVVKPIIAAAALQEGIIKESTSFLSTGGIKVNDWFFPDWKIGGHGITNVRKALAESINTFFYIIGGGLLDSSYKNFTFNGLGVEKIAEYARKFGLANKLGIDLPNESTGFLPSKEWKESVKKEQWYIGDTYHLAIGQGDLTVTPLQVNAWTAVFANGGKLYQPHILKTVMLKNNTVQPIEPKILNENFISPENIMTVRQGLRDGVTYGSSRALSDLNVAVAGKTGTAQWGTNKKSHAWFTGFAPYEKPEIAITVLVEEAGEGSAISVPIAKEILWWYFNVKN